MEGVYSYLLTFSQGYIWGQSLVPIFDTQRRVTNSAQFDLIILSDLIFNHSQVSYSFISLLGSLTDKADSQHEALLKTTELALKPSSSDQTHRPCVLVFYSHHRPHLAHRDMDFFTKAKERGWLCEEILTEKFPVRNLQTAAGTLDDVKRCTDVAAAYVS